MVNFIASRSEDCGAYCAVWSKGGVCEEQAVNRLGQEGSQRAQQRRRL